LLEIRIPRQVVANPPPEPDPEEPAPVRAVFTGSFGDLGLQAGDSIEMIGSDLSGEYLVNSITDSELTLNYSDLAPVISPTSGTYQTTIDRLGARYEIQSRSSSSITVDKQLPDGAPDTGWGGFPSQRSNNFTIRLALTAADGE